MFSREVLKDPTAPALALLGVVVDKYGLDVLAEEPEFLRKDIEEDFNITMSDLQSDKIQAAITIIATDHYEGQWEVFQTVSLLLNGVPASFDTMEEIQAEEVAAALAHYRLFSEETTAEEEIAPPVFSDEVKAFLGVVFANYGMTKAPDIFPEAIMPEGRPDSPPEINASKNDALREIYTARRNQIREYVAKMTH